jgi:alpha,alpha-trehalase
MENSVKRLHEEFARLRPMVICPASGFIKYDYLVPGGFYKQMWDWDGFFIGVHMTTRSKEEAVYLKRWAQSFISVMKEDGYVPGAITTNGPHTALGHFPMKPFLAQGILIGSRKLGDFSWIEPLYNSLKTIVQYREKSNFDSDYGLFYWDNAMQSGADNNVAVSNDPVESGSTLACDVNTFQLREYIAISKIAEQLNRPEDVEVFTQKSEDLTAAIQHYHWSAEDEAYWNILRASGEPVKRVTYSNFVPLIQGLAPYDDGRKMIRRYLWNEDHMLSPYGLRTLSKQDPEYNNVNMIVPYSNWQGPIWPITNYLYFRALMTYGFFDEAKQLAKMICDLCLRDIDKWGSMHENYDAETGEALAPSPDHFSTGVFEGFVGWNLLVENMQEEVENLDQSVENVLDPLNI